MNEKDNNEKEFSCRIIEVHEHTTSDSQDKKKEGRYHNSNFPYVPKKKYVVSLKITSDDLSHLKEREGGENLVKGYLRFLTKQTIGVRKPKPKYGNLSLYEGYSPFKFSEDKEGNEQVSVLVLTDEPNNKHFWGTAPKFGRIRVRGNKQDG
jgi:hypothetical protein